MVTPSIHRDHLSLRRHDPDQVGRSAIVSPSQLVSRAPARIALAYGSRASLSTSGLRSLPASHGSPTSSAASHASHAFRAGDASRTGTLRRRRTRTLLPFTTRGFTLEPWQRDAARAWVTVGTGTLEIFTGGGKTLIALAAIASVAEREPALRVAVAVPTIALAEQWRVAFERHTSLRPVEIGILGGGKRASLATHRVTIAVLNSAAKAFPEQSRAIEPVMLVVDECHRAGAPSFAKIFATRTAYRLGLSATPYRDEVGADGEPLAWHEQTLGRELGEVVYAFTLRDARAIGWLPEYAIHHHGVALDADERRAYVAQSDVVDGNEAALKKLGGDAARAWALQRRRDPLGVASARYVASVAKRKDIVYAARERNRIALRIVAERFAGGRDARVLIFNERVDAATALYDALTAADPTLRVALEHSGLGAARRLEAVERFRAGDADVLVSVRALAEGIDVPGADVGISVASSSSVRARIQLLGRVLRRTFDGSEKRAVTHLIYAAETVDELIYAREDWSDLTGPARNEYYRWPLGADVPETRPSAPATPAPTEAQEAARIGILRAGDPPQRWLGIARGTTYSMNAAGVVTNAMGRAIVDPFDVGRALARVRGRPDGTFRVTPRHRYVIVYDPSAGGWVAAASLREPFVTEDAGGDADAIDVARLAPGDASAGPRTKEGGTYRMTSAGRIKRKRRGGGVDFAEPDDVRALVDAWRALRVGSIAIDVNLAGHAWWRDATGPRYLGLWPVAPRFVPGDVSPR
ncbi:MAG: hypothetical protein NVSMB21_01680 [Vulcanimicrobiaceae bacterium]